MKYYSAVKRNEVVIQATRWMNPETIMLSKTRKKTTYSDSTDVKCPKKANT